MFDDIRLGFLAALVDIAAQRFGLEDAFVLDCRAAAQNGDVARARQLLESIAPETADALLAAVHRRLSRETGAVLANLSPAPGSKPN
jgi:hypothetical protein